MMSAAETSQPIAPATPMSLDEASQIRFLDPKKLKFSRAGAVLRLTVDGECSYLKAGVFRVFPLTSPDSYLSVMAGGGSEVGIVRSLDGMDPGSRRLVEEELSRRYFMPAIRRIQKVVERFGAVEWHVDTDRGPCRFTTRDLRENVLRLGPSRYIISDVDDNRFEVPDSSRLDSKSLSMLLRRL